MADIIKTSYMDKADIGYSEYIAKKSTDIDLVDAKPGDRVFVLEEGKVYICVDSGEWEELVISGGGGGGGETITVDDKMSESSTNPVQNKVITTALNDKVSKEGYNKLNGYYVLDEKGTFSLYGTLDLNGKNITNVRSPINIYDVSNKLYVDNQDALAEKLSHKVTNLSAASTDAQYASAKAIVDYVDSEIADKAIIAEDGSVSQNLDFQGDFALDIDDPDYDAAIVLDRRLDDNRGTILTLNGMVDETPYKVAIENVATPFNAYDAANKKYVDDNIVIPTYHLVFLNEDGTVDSYASTINYATIKANLTDPREKDYLDVSWKNDAAGTTYTRFYAEVVEITEVNNGDIKFIADLEYDGIARRITFTLDPNSTLVTTLLTTEEIVSNKSQNIVADTGSTSKYPSIKAVEDFLKPVTIWESNTPSEYLKALQADISASPSWQLTNLDMTPFKRIKIYTCSGRSTGSTANASTTAAMVLEMSLDSRAAISAYGGNYVGSIISQKPNDNNRLATLTCAVSADKTSFAVLRQTNLYGTAVTSNNDVNANVFLIEGYYY